MTMTPADEIYAVGEVAYLVGLSPEAVRYAIRTGTLPAQKLGPVWTVRVEDAER